MDEIAKAAEVGILDGVGWMKFGCTRRRCRVRVFRWDVGMGLSTLWTPKGGELDGVLIEAGVRVDGEGFFGQTGGVEAILWLEGAILGLEGARHPKSGGLIDDVLPVVSHAIFEFKEVLEGAAAELSMLHFVDVESGEDDVEIVCATAPGDVRDEEAEGEAAISESCTESAGDLGEGCGGIGNGARVFVGVDIDEKWKDVAAELDEREADVRALRGVEAVELVPLV